MIVFYAKYGVNIGYTFLTFGCIVILECFLCEIILFYCFTNYPGNLGPAMVASFLNKISFAHPFCEKLK